MGKGRRTGVFKTKKTGVYLSFLHHLYYESFAYWGTEYWGREMLERGSSTTSIRPQGKQIVYPHHMSDDTCPSSLTTFAYPSTLPKGVNQDISQQLYQVWRTDRERLRPPQILRAGTRQQCDIALIPRKDAIRNSFSSIDFCRDILRTSRSAAVLGHARETSAS
ncbi:hypothetical protein EJ06DRAFT_367442 [Trichodelitschia bisporula]|uniref:Uncharacterized protein n=1 Tax=Trichodelitschia bisporula TaxID=703511 RepID=A0A6G1I0V5_9PEZI|nr:hypothetical protein EJ06DRAFT_367442 [Trichodelitschia bisporula]